MRAREIVILVAGAALLRSYSAAFRTTTHVHGMRVAVVTLPGKVASRMAIHASRVMQNGQHCLEGSSRCRITLHYPRSWALNHFRFVGVEASDLATKYRRTRDNCGQHSRCLDINPEDALSVRLFRRVQTF